MRKISAILLIICVAFVKVTYSQNGPIAKFDKLEYDYGTIAEEKGKVKAVFTFLNVGTDSLKITMIRPGCNCITYDFTKNGIIKKKKGSITLEFDPMNRPGSFSYNATVYTNSPTQPQITLTLKGMVTPRPKTYKELYPAVIGHLRFDSPQYNFKNVNMNEIRKDTIIIYNEWHSPIKMSTRDVLPHFSVTLIPEIIQPNKTALMIVTYDASKKQEYGYIYDRFFLTTNDSLQPDKNISISMNIIEDFSKLTPEQLANAAKIKFDNQKCNFGTIKEGSEATCEYQFTNTGNSELIIRRVKASCGCTATNPEKTNLKPGESSKITAKFHSAGKQGQQMKTITVICNDPTNSTIMLTLEGTVEAQGTQPQH